MLIASIAPQHARCSYAASRIMHHLLTAVLLCFFLFYVSIQNLISIQIQIRSNSIQLYRIILWCTLLHFVVLNCIILLIGCVGCFNLSHKRQYGMILHNTTPHRTTSYNTNLSIIYHIISYYSSCGEVDYALSFRSIADSKDRTSPCSLLICCKPRSNVPTARASK